jgi:hypothetical protein
MLRGTESWPFVATPVAPAKEPALLKREANLAGNREHDHRNHLTFLSGER